MKRTNRMTGQDLKLIFGKNIKFYRFHRKFSQAILAEKADISITFLSNIERGLKFPKPDIITKIAESLEVNVYELFKISIVPEDSKKLINQLSADILSKVNQAMEDVFNEYKK
ncbi:MAG: helix-turn-helix domain-containing protein [Treponema sp.]|jgi:transcriptional regulator with XRE-family HTH domain|nr:helix-turn-helix domain-containing protein [Treponema sp.]